MPRQRKAYTLLEILVVVAILGIAGAMVIPSMGSTSVLQVQSSVRAVVSDITFAQSDALAYQDRRAIVFDMDTNSYSIFDVNGPEIDPDTDILFDGSRAGRRYIVDLNDRRFGGATITDVSIDSDNILIFDELGGPVLTLTGEQPSAGGYVEISGSGQVFRVEVEAYTGRVTVRRVDG